MSNFLTTDRLSQLALGQFAQAEREAAVEQLLAQPDGLQQWRLARALQPAASSLAHSLVQHSERHLARAWWFALPASAAAVMLLLSAAPRQDFPDSALSMTRSEVVLSGSFETDRELFHGRFEE